MLENDVVFTDTQNLASPYDRCIFQGYGFDFVDLHTLNFFDAQHAVLILIDDVIRPSGLDADESAPEISVGQAPEIEAAHSER